MADKIVFLETDKLKTRMKANEKEKPAKTTAKKDLLTKTFFYKREACLACSAKRPTACVTGLWAGR